MFALIAALFFVLALLFDVAGVAAGDVLTAGVLSTAGLLCLALHLMGVGAGWSPLKKQ
ncbi:hypothetical protein AB0I81_49590 [Nonomuraea sp. NPDC050404]|uniref:hypothetical protein n=1 Tax=Nonomuraea sp. NPDC050404 TaxID=3155783 RepID=UPI003409045C